MRAGFAPARKRRSVCVMGGKLSSTIVGVALSVAFAASAGAQETIELPTINVTSSRLGGSITGASTSVITAQQIAQSPAQSLPDILAQVTGVQVMHVLGGPTGTEDMIDLRGFGAFAQSNVLILVNGRRYQDFDLQGFDFSTIPLNSIERIEVTRGNSGAVLYGDGAVGGVINIVTKNAASVPQTSRIEGIVGSYGYEEGRLSVARSSGPWSASLFSNVVTSSGYRQNSRLRQQDAVANLNYAISGASAYLRISANHQHQGLPGGLPNMPLVYPVTLSDPRGTDTPYDWASKKDFNLTAGGKKTSAANITIISTIRPTLTMRRPRCPMPMTPHG
jgi:iron complex outermembrane receptor protein